MAECRKGKQLNFRLTDELAERFEDYCKVRGITMTQFFENSIRQALGQPLTIPQNLLGISQNIANVKTIGTAITAVPSCFTFCFVAYTLASLPHPGLSV